MSVMRQALARTICDALAGEQEPGDEDRVRIVDAALRVYEAAIEERSSERLAKLIERMAKESPYSRFPQSRISLAIAAKLVRRGRPFTPEENMRELIEVTDKDEPPPRKARPSPIRRETK